MLRFKGWSLQKRSIKQFLIYPKFQLRLIAINIVALSIAFVAIIFQNFYLFSKLHKMGADAGMPADHPFHQFINFQESQFTTMTWLTLFGILFVFTITSLIISHRVAGPIVRLKEFFTAMKQTGKMTPLHFRKNDFFDDLPEIVNDSLDSLSKPKNS